MKRRSFFLTAAALLAAPTTATPAAAPADIPPLPCPPAPLPEFGYTTDDEFWRCGFRTMQEAIDAAIADGADKFTAGRVEWRHIHWPSPAETAEHVADWLRDKAPCSLEHHLVEVVCGLNEEYDYEGEFQWDAEVHTPDLAGDIMAPLAAALRRAGADIYATWAEAPPDDLPGSDEFPAELAATIGADEVMGAELVTLMQAWVAKHHMRLNSLVTHDEEDHQRPAVPEGEA